MSLLWDKVAASVSPAIRDVAGNLAAWVAGIHRGVSALGQLTGGGLNLIRALVAGIAAIAAYKAAMLTITIAQKAVAVGQAIVLALSGPVGWAQLAIGLLVAAAAGLTVAASFRDVTNSAKQSGDAAAGAGQGLAEVQQQLARTDEAAGKVKATLDSITEGFKTFAMSTIQRGAFQVQQAGGSDQDVQKARAMADALEHWGRVNELAQHGISADPFGALAKGIDRIKLSIGDAEIAARMIDRLREAAEKAAEVKGIELTEGVRSAAEKLRGELSIIESLLSHGKITAETAGLAAQQALAKYTPAAQLPPAALQGTQQALSEVNRFNAQARGGDPQAQIKKVLEDANRQREQGLKLARDTAKALENLKQANLGL
jgi:hypothetical protein